MAIATGKASSENISDSVKNNRYGLWRVTLNYFAVKNLLANIKGKCKPSGTAMRKISEGEAEKPAPQ